MINKSVLLILPSSDFNEQEYLIVSRSLQKFNIKVFVASETNSLCVGSNGLKVKNDVQFYNIHEGNFAGIIFIGGKGVKDYWNNPLLHSLVNKFKERKKFIAAICSASVILAKAGVLIEKATGYPDDRKEIEKEGIEFSDMPVVITQNIITGKDPSSSADFTKAILHEISKLS